MLTLPVVHAVGITTVVVVYPDGRSFSYIGEIYPGDALVPHSAVLALDGSGYVEFPHSDSFNSRELSVVAIVRPYSHPDWNAIVSKDELDWRLYISQVSDRWDFMRRDLNGNVYVAEDGAAGIGERILLIAVSNSTHISIYVNGSLAVSASWSGAPAGHDYPLLIGVNSYNGSVMWAQAWQGEIELVAIYDRALSPEEIADIVKGIFPGNGLTLFFEPGMKNGDLFWAIKAEGIARGNVATQPLSGMLSIIRGLYSDSMLHFLWLPAGSIIEVYQDGDLVASYQVEATGIIRQYAIPWPPVPVETFGSPTALNVVIAVLALVGVFSPLLAFKTGVIGSVVSGMATMLAVVLLLRTYSLAGSEKVWIEALLYVLVIMVILDIAILLYHVVRYMQESRRPRGLFEEPEPPWL